MMTKRVPLLLLVASSALLLAGCTPPAPVETALPTPTPAPTASATPTEEPPVTSTPTAGDCPAAPGTGPVIYTVFTSDSTTPVTISYQTFNADGSIPIVTETVTGPIVTRIGYDCADAAGSTLWTFTATITSGGDVACVQAFGGKLVKTDSQYNEGATTPLTADCTGNPGM